MLGQDLRGARGLLAERVGQIVGHDKPECEVRRVQLALRRSQWNATALEGNLEDSVPKLKDKVDGDLFMHGQTSSPTPSPRRG